MINQYITKSIFFLFLISSALSFGQQIDFELNDVGPNATADQIRSIFSEDIDDDGDVDIVVASADNHKIAWYENEDGQGTFSTEKILIDDNLPSSASLSNIYAADLDNDGDIDILSSMFHFQNGGKIVWFENLDGQGSFSGEQIIISTTYNGEIVASDIDNDNDLDIIYVYSGEIFWLENVDGQANFSAPSSLSSLNTLMIMVSDLDNDGDMDILSGYNSYVDRIAWLKNDGSGNFTEVVNVEFFSDDLLAIHIADLDNDSDDDILAFVGNEILWYKNTDGLGNFESGGSMVNNQLNYAAAYLDAADLDNDGDMDIISSSSTPGAIQEVMWYENVDSQGTFGIEQAILNYPGNIGNLGTRHVLSSDINNDGNIDVFITLHQADRVGWLKNNGALTNEINGNVQIDLNSNGCDIDDVFLPYVMIVTSDLVNDYITYTGANGIYQIFPPNEGEYTTSIQLPNYYTTNDVSISSNFTGTGNTDTIDFCLEPMSSVNDLSVIIYPLFDEPRPGFDTTYRIIYNNIGTTNLSGNVIFEFDDSKLQFLSASEIVNLQTANTLTFDFTDLNPFEARTIDMEFNVFPPPTTNIDDELISTATINPVAGDETEADNTFSLHQTVIGSYDPNDIRVIEGDEILIDDIDKYLHYIIRFQNTGTASAINVRVAHTLDDKLDWTTMQLESLSHTGRVQILNGSDVEFIFDDINLPDSTSDEPNSHGYIAFKIKPKNDVVVGDIISGVADIYFDFNPAIITNAVSTEVVEPLSVDEFNDNSFSAFPNPAATQVTIEGKVIIEAVSIFDINGRLLKLYESQETELRLNINDLPQGIYFLEVQSGNSKQTLKLIKN